MEDGATRNQNALSIAQKETIAIELEVSHENQDTSHQNFRQFKEKSQQPDNTSLA
jgi:hypothetical protein